MANLGFDMINATSVTMKIASNTTPVLGMAVTLTGNEEVGKGVEGNALFGIIRHIVGDGTVVVQTKGYAEKVAISSTGSKQPAAGDVVAVDGAGALIKLGTLTVASTTATVVAYGGRAISVDTTNKTATIEM